MTFARKGAKHWQVRKTLLSSGPCITPKIDSAARRRVLRTTTPPAARRHIALNERHADRSRAVDRRRTALPER